MAKFTTKNLSLSEIRIDGGTQPRAEIDEQYIRENLVPAIDGGATMPPLTVFHDGKYYWLADGAITTNALRNPYIFMQDAGQTYGIYYIVVDSIVGEPDETENPAIIADYDYKLMNRVYVSLTDKLGRVIISDSKMIKCAWAAYPGHGAHFFLHPSKDDVGVPFNIEFEILPYKVDLMVWNGVEIQNGATPWENIDLLQGESGGSNSVP